MIGFAPAKINIGLYVTSKRADNYHNIESLFYPVNLFDIIEIEKSNSFELLEYGLKTDCDYKENLCYKAWKLIQDKYNIPEVKIHLFKQIPFQAGLGGGSSDAVCVLKLLNKYFNLEISDSELERLALELGSDCPFFVKSVPAFAYGRGEILKPISEFLKGKFLIILKPEIGSSTKNAFSKVKIAEKSEFENLISQEISNWKERLINVFEEVVLLENPELNKIKEHLYVLGAEYVSMSGSGTAFYGIFTEKPELKKNDFNQANYWIINL